MAPPEPAPADNVAGNYVLPPTLVVFALANTIIGKILILLYKSLSLPFIIKSEVVVN